METEHHNISRAPGVLGRPAQGGTHGITGLVYKSIRGVTKLVGSSLNVGLAPLSLLSRDAHSTPEREAALAVLNGILGEHLVATASPLAITMRLRRQVCLCSSNGMLYRLPFQKSVASFWSLCMASVAMICSGFARGEIIGRRCPVTWDTQPHICTTTPGGMSPTMGRTLPPCSNLWYSNGRSE